MNTYSVNAENLSRELQGQNPEGEIIIDPETGSVVKSFSFICLRTSSTNLCLGLSPGNEPEMYPEIGMGLQIKPRDRNEERHLDYRKMRWDINVREGRIRLSNFTDLCLGVEADERPYQIFLQNCTLNSNSSQSWVVEPAGVMDFPAAVVIRQKDTGRCMSVRHCILREDGSCRAGDVELNDHFLRGAWVDMTDCFDGRGRRAARNAQLFQVHLDCAPGCSEDMLGNGVCDRFCNNDNCKYDVFDCGKDLDGNIITPTQSPTFARTSNENAQASSSGWLWFFIILCICVLIVVAYRRRRRRLDRMQAIGEDDEFFGNSKSQKDGNKMNDSPHLEDIDMDAPPNQKNGRDISII